MATYKSAPGSNGSFAMDKFVPEVWSGRILKNLHDKQKMATLTTREYEGEIKGKGDTVKIHGVGAIDIRDYVTNKSNGDAVTYDIGSDTEILVEVDTAKYFAFKVEDIEQAQAHPKFITELSSEAAVAMSKVTDNYIWDKMVTAADGAAVAGGLNAGGSSAANGGRIDLTYASAGDMYADIVDIGTRLDDLLCPDDNRFLVVPSFAYGLLLKEPLFVGANTAGQAGARDKRVLGTIAGFEIMSMPRSSFDRSDQYTADSVACIAGRKGAYAYVEQIAKVENLRLEGFFADAVRGLHLFGGGAIRQEFLVACDIVDPAGAYTIS